MKKFFSLVLALVMALSLTTVAWGADPVKVSTPEELAAELTADKETISVVLQNDIDLPITSLGTITPGSGEYKLGGDSTKNIVIDLNEKKLNITTTYWSAIGAKNADATITIKNGSMTSTGNSATTWNAWDLRFCNCNWTFENVDFLKAVALDNAGKTTNMTNVTITDNSNNDVYGLWITGEGQTVNINGLVMDMQAATDGRGIKIDNQYVDATNEKKVTLDVSKATFITEEKSAIIVKTTVGADITASNCDISKVNEDSTNLVWIDEDAADSANLVSVTGATGIVETSTTVVYVAQVNGVKYETLAKAVAAAADGDTVVLLANNTEAVVLPVGVALDAGSYSHAVTAPTGYQLLKDTNNVYKVVPVVTMGDKFDLYLADKNMNTMLALEVPSVAGLSFTEVKANTYKDGSGNVAYIVANNGEYYVKTSTPYTTSYAVTEAGETDVLYYVNVGSAGAGYYAYEASVTAFNKFSTYDKCGYVTDTPDATDVYFQTAAGVVYKAKASVEADATKNYLLDGEVVTAGDVQKVVDHEFMASGYKYDTKLKVNVPTSALCSKCLMTSTTIYEDGKVPAATKFYELYEGNKATDYSVVAEAAPSAGGTTTPSTDTKVESAATFDAGIAMYVGMSVMAAAGSVVVLKKRED